MRLPAASGTSRAAPSLGKRKACASSISRWSKTTGSTGGTTIRRRRFGGRSRPSFPDVPVLRRARSEYLVRFLRHGVDARRVDPAVVKVEQRADGDGVVDGFIRPTRGVERLHVLGG